MLREIKQIEFMDKFSGHTVKLKQIMRQFIFVLSVVLLFISSPLQAQVTLAQLESELSAAENNSNLINQTEIIESLKTSINWLKESENSRANSKRYQSVIDNYSNYVNELNIKIKEALTQPLPKITAKTAADFEQAIIRASSQRLELDRQVQQEQELLREISLTQTPQLIANARNRLSEIQRRLSDTTTETSPLSRIQGLGMQAEQYAQSVKIEELELSQLSANNRQELARLRIELYRARYDASDAYLDKLRDELNTLRQKEAEKVLAQTNEIAESQTILPFSIQNLLNRNRDLSETLNQETQSIQSLVNRQRLTATHTQEVRDVLNNFTEQAQWLGSSPVLGESLRAEVARLPEMPLTQSLNTDMADIKVKRISFQRELNDLPLITELFQDDGEPLTKEQTKIASAQLNTKRELLSSLLANLDTQTVELTRLIVANSQLIDALSQVREASHRHLFWIADLSPVSIQFPFEIAKDGLRFFSAESIKEIHLAINSATDDALDIFSLFASALLVLISFSLKKKHFAFLQRSSIKVGKVTQDSFYLTIRALIWALFMSLPLPILWATIGNILSNAWEYPLAAALGNGVLSTVPILWIFMLSKLFSHPQGLFRAHFRWKSETVNRAMRYYSLSIWVIVPLIVLTTTFDTYNDREFANSLGRFAFILLCIAITLVTLSFKRAGVLILKSNRNANDGIINRFFWTFLIAAPIVAAIAASTGYLSTSIALLIRLETSLLIIFTLRFTYHLVHRGMLIQRRKLDFERAKQKRAEILAERAKQGQLEETKEAASSEGAIEIEMVPIDLDTISAQSLRLVGSLLTLAGFMLVALLWSELHSAFGFLNNFRLWQTTQIVQGTETVQAITIGSLLVAALVFIITAQLVRNLPALLELAILQHLELQPGTGFTITTLTKYVIMLIGGIIGFSWIGIEWSKLQWLVAALGVGLGFGLQEIFANFISGLILLFEKPVRIGDVVTLRNLTGTIARIRTRATEIVDFDNKEIIVPNKAFITEQFINWSLSDPITRIIMTIPVEQDADTELVTELLLKAANDCDMVVDTPVPPEAFLINMENGIQQFNLRVHTNSVRFLMPLRHAVHQNILRNFRLAGLKMPYPPIQVRTEMAHKV